MTTNYDTLSGQEDDATGPDGQRCPSKRTLGKKDAVGEIWTRVTSVAG